MAAILKKPSGGNVYKQRILEREGISCQFMLRLRPLLFDLFSKKYDTYTNNITK